MTSTTPSSRRATALAVLGAVLAALSVAPAAAAPATTGDPHAPVVVSPTEGSEHAGEVQVEARWSTNPHPYPTKVGVVAYQYAPDGSSRTWNIVHTDAPTGIVTRWTPPAAGRWGIQALRCDGRVVCMSPSAAVDVSAVVGFTARTATSGTSPSPSPSPAATSSPSPTSSPAPSASGSPSPSAGAPASTSPAPSPSAGAPAGTSPSPAPARSDVTVVAPEHVARGADVALTGTAPAGALVTVTAELHGTQPVRLTHRVRADAAGTWTDRWQAEVDTTFSADAGRGPSAPVRTRVTGTWASTASSLVARGSTVVLTGLAEPGSAVQVLFRPPGGTFTLRRTVSATSTGSWVTHWTASTDQEVLARAAGHDSAVVAVRVAYATISGPASAPYRSTVVLTGTARPGSRVAIAFRRAGTSTFVLRRTVVASAAGTYRTTYTADAAQAYVATADGVRSAVRSTALRAPAPGSACSTTAPLFSHADSARCLHVSYLRKDRAMALHYAVRSVADTVYGWSAAQRRPAPWHWDGCGRASMTTPSSGIACGFVDGATPDFHGVYLEFGMGRDLRVESLETAG